MLRNKPSGLRDAALLDWLTACEQMSAAYERGRMSRDAEVAQLVAALQNVIEITDGVRGLPCEEDLPCADLCGNSWCSELGCIPQKLADARDAIKAAGGR